MDSFTTKRWATIARKLREIAQEIEDLANQQIMQKEQKFAQPKAHKIVIDEALVEDIRGRGREGAIEYLNTLSHKQLGSILRSLGGPSEETKRTKEMITDRILYRMFDYASGHRIMKGETEENKK